MRKSKRQPRRTVGLNFTEDEYHRVMPAIIVWLEKSNVADLSDAGAVKAILKRCVEAAESGVKASDMLRIRKGDR